MHGCSRRLLPLNPLRAFEAAARHLSFTKAAQELNVTQGAISRHIRALEKRLGFPLFIRTPQGLELNHSSRVFAKAIEEAFTHIAWATDRLTTTQSHSVLTLRGYTTFLVRWLLPRLPDFQHRHPDIEVRVVTAANAVQFDRDAVDVGIRYGSGKWPSWRSDLLFSDELIPVCSRQYLQTQKTGSPSAVLSESTLLHHNLRPNDWPDWLRIAGLANFVPKENKYFEDLGIIYESARAGMGFAMMQRSYIENDLVSGDLKQPFDAVLRRDLGYYFVCPSDRADIPKIRIFRDWLLHTANARSVSECNPGVATEAG